MLALDKDTPELYPLIADVGIELAGTETVPLTDKLFNVGFPLTDKAPESVKINLLT